MAIRKLELAVRADMIATIKFLTSMGFTGLKLVSDKEDFVSFKFADLNKYILNENFGTAKNASGGKLVWSWPGEGILVVRPSKLVVLRNRPSKTKVKISERISKPVVPTNVQDTHTPLTIKEHYKKAQATRKFKAFVLFAWDHYNKAQFEGKLPPPSAFILNKDDSKVQVLGRWFPSARQLEIHPRVLLADFSMFNEVMLHEMCHQAVTDIDKFTGREENNGHGPKWAAWMTRVGLNPSAYVNIRDTDFHALKVQDDKLKEEIQKTAPKLIPTNRYLRLPVVCQADIYGKMREGAIVEAAAGKLYFVDADPNATLPLVAVTSGKVFEYQGPPEKIRSLIPGAERTDKLFREQNLSHLRKTRLPNK